jgi:hypothetical protein
MSKTPMIYSVVEQMKTGERKHEVKMFLKGKEINLLGGFEMTVGAFGEDPLYTREEVEEAIKKHKGLM